jgi:hypothetical protein
MVVASPLNFGVEVEEGVNAVPQLTLDLFASAFEHVHGYRGRVAVSQLHGSFADLLYFFCGEQPHSVDQHQIRHSSILFVHRSPVAFACPLTTR